MSDSIAFSAVLSALLNLQRCRRRVTSEIEGCLLLDEGGAAEIHQIVRRLTRQQAQTDNEIAKLLSLMQGSESTNMMEKGFAE